MYFKRLFLASLIIGISSYILYTLSIPFYADILFKRGSKALEATNYPSAIYYFNSAIEHNPTESFYYEGRSQAFALASLSSESNEDKTALKDLALKDMEYSFTLNPKNLRSVRNNLSTYYLLSLKDLGTPPIIDYSFLGVTKKYFYFVKTNYKSDVGTLVDIARYEKLLGWSSDYESTITMIKTLRPDLLEWHPYLIN